MREGRFLAEATPRQILARTGASDLEEAFLRLATHREKALLTGGDR
jgi:ABC-2 type transport system ATP-binding protein